MGVGAFAAVYIMMEVHYDNPQGLSGLTDLSGVQV
jgi:hypothetical protein